MIKKDKNEKINSIKKVIGLVIILAILIFFARNIYLLIKDPTDVFIVEEGKLELEEDTVGYIIRDEKVMTGEHYQNGIVQIKAEGEKAAKGEQVFRYYSNDEENLKKQIKELDVKIQEALDGQTEIYSGDIKTIEKQIESKLDQLSNTNSIQKIEEYRKEIEELTIKKAKIAGDLSPSGSYIKSLINQRSSLESTLNSGSEYMIAEESGIVSYKVDGLENVFTPDNFSELNEEMLEKLNIKTGQTIATSEKSGKIISNFECYIASILTSENAKKAQEGDTVTLRMSNKEEIKANIAYKKEQSDQKYLFVFKITKNVEELISCRKISFNVVWWSDKGLKVPNSAILEENGKQYIIRNRAGYTDKILVKILRKNEKYSIVDNYDTKELEELGYTIDEINNRKIITLHDEVLLKAK